MSYFNFHSNLRKCVLTLLFCLAVTSCGGGSTEDSTAPPPATFTPNSIKGAIDYGIDRGLDGVWVYVDEGDGQPVVEVSGVANRTSLQLAEPSAQFKIASISKLFIAVSATKLAAQDILDLDDTLAFWLPTIAGRIDNSENITLEQLLRHRSGVPDFDSQFGFSWQDAHTDNAELLALVLDLPADFAPDSRYEYSNTNYLLLGMILDEALGYSHHDYVQSAILSPLGMLQTFSLQSETDTALMASGYWENVNRLDQQYVAPGGSMVSVVSDIGVFMRELATGSLLTDEERDIFLSLYDSYAHSGWLPGYQSVARYNAVTNTVVVQFVNTTGGASEEVATEVYDLVVEYVRNN